MQPTKANEKRSPREFLATKNEKSRRQSRGHGASRRFSRGACKEPRQEASGALDRAIDDVPTRAQAVVGAVEKAAANQPRRPAARGRDSSTEGFSKKPNPALIRRCARSFSEQRNATAARSMFHSAAASCSSR